MSEEIDKALLSYHVRAGIVRAGGKDDDEDLFERVYASVVKSITEPCMKLIIPSFGLLPPSRKREPVSIENMAGLYAYTWYINDLEFFADMIRWGIVIEE